MKPLYKIIISIVLFVVPGMALASMSIPADLDDTIPAAPRCDKYYYTKWFDDCPNYYPNGIVDSCFNRYYTYHSFYDHYSVSKWEYTKQRMKVKGLVAMIDRYVPPYAADSNWKQPEYLYLYQLVGRHYAFLQSYGIEDGLDFVLVDSVRWDTATARVMELRRGTNPAKTQYCYLYEAYFENPVYIDSDFYIFGSTNSNVRKFPGSGLWRYIPTYYVDIMDFGDYDRDPKCDSLQYESIRLDEWCRGQGGYVGITDDPSLYHDSILPNPGWYSPWPDSPWGYYLAIVDQWNLNAVPDNAEHGEVIGGGRWPDDTYDTIEAIPAPGYHFFSWNDGNTDNPRVIHLTSDTSFVAVCYSPLGTIPPGAARQGKLRHPHHSEKINIIQ